MTTSRRTLLILTLVPFWFSGCGRTAPTNEEAVVDDRINCVTTTGMVTDIVAAVGGEHVRVTGIISPGVDPHLFKPGRSDRDQLMNAGIVFYSGLKLEGQMGDQFESLREKGHRIAAVTAGLDESKLRQPADFEGHFDPHVWMDVSMWSECVDDVAHQLSLLTPEHHDSYQKNAEAYREKLKQLDDHVRKLIGTIPEEQRILVTAHDAFEYFADAYGVEVRSIQGISTESQAAISDINDLVDFIVEHKVPAIFVESSVSSKNVEAVIEGCADRGWTLKIGGELFSDAMGAPGTPEGTYIGMIEHNAKTITTALGGSAEVSSVGEATRE
jgi:manganese/zinc/iron transport system substrate-binding protein